MDKDTEKVLAEAYTRLHPKLKAAIEGMTKTGLLQSICEKYGLRVDQINSVYTETLLVMLALQSPADLVDNVSKETGLNETTATKVAEEIGARIFETVKFEIAEAHGIIDTEGEANNSDDITNKTSLTPAKSLLRTNMTLQTNPSQDVAPKNEEKKPLHTDPYRESPE